MGCKANTGCLRQRGAPARFPSPTSPFCGAGYWTGGPGCAWITMIPEDAPRMWSAGAARTDSPRSHISIKGSGRSGNCLPASRRRARIWRIRSCMIWRIATVRRWSPWYWNRCLRSLRKRGRGGMVPAMYVFLQGIFWTGLSRLPSGGTGSCARSRQG